MSTDQPHTPSPETAESCFLDGAAGEFLAEDWSAFLARVKRDAAQEALDGLEADTAQIIRTMRKRGEQGWARYAIANDILDAHRARFYPEGETP